MDIPNVPLSDGCTIPQVGLGLWKVIDASEFDEMFSCAIAAGYRHFDSAQAYDNEALLGDAWVNAGRVRSEFFLTTKIDVAHFGKNSTMESFEKSLVKLRTDYVDLLLLHFPVTALRKSSWLALETIQASGRAKSIGVSNYTIRHLKEMEKYAHVTPAVNQVELHVFLQQPELISYCEQKGIKVEAYSPLAHAKNMESAVICEIAAKHNVTYAQVMLRWCVQRGLIVLPKSVTPERIRENIDIFAFELDNEDMNKISALDAGDRTCWDPTLVP